MSGQRVEGSEKRQKRKTVRGVGRRASSEEEQRGRRGNDLARARARVVYARLLTQPSVCEGDDRVEFRVRERSKSSAGLGSHAGV